MKSSPKYSLILFLLIIFLVPQLSFGQQPTVGVKLGLAIANATVNQVDTYPYNGNNNSPRTTLLGGLYADIHTGKDLIFRPGVEIVFKGFKQKSGGPYYYDYITKFTYIDIPLNLVYKKASDKGHFLVGGGPIIGFPINHIYSNYEVTSEFSINGLIGYELPIGFSLNLNYVYGLNNVSKNKQYVTKISNHYLGIWIGYSF